MKDDSVIVWYDPLTATTMSTKYTYFLSEIFYLRTLLAEDGERKRYSTAY